MALGSGSNGSGGAGSRIVPAGNGVRVGAMNTPGITADMSSTRVARVGVSVAVGVAVAVTVALGVIVIVGMEVWVAVGV